MKIYRMLILALAAGVLIGVMDIVHSVHTSYDVTVLSPITNVPDIAAGTKQLALVGRPVAIVGVPVEQVAGNREFWVGPTDTDRVLVIVDAISLRQAVQSNRGVHRAETVNVHGTLERVPGIRGNVRVISWGHLDPEDVMALKKARVYVYATNVQVS